jgi:MazG family protein
MQDNSALGRAMRLVRDLRDRCPWDRAQTRDTLRPYLVEEALELDQALGSGSADEIRNELADVLLNVAFQLVIAEESGQFTADDVAQTLERKIQRRHPHLFDVGPKEAWEVIKHREREGEGGLLDGLPPTLPPLLMAHRLQERAAAVGFDWPDTDGPVAKIREELVECEAELFTPGEVGDEPRLREELGDLLFAVVNLARKVEIAPSVALDGANRKFRSRFDAMERLAAERGIDVHTAGLDLLDTLWDETKLES